MSRDIPWRKRLSTRLVGFAALLLVASLPLVLGNFYLLSSVRSDAASMARAAQALANDKNVTAVACFTMQGQTAWLMSKIRPRVPILAFTPDQDTYQRLAFMWGVSPRLVPFVNSLEEMIDHVDKALMRSDVVQAGDQVVLVCGFPVGAIRPPNMALLYTVGE